MFDTVVQDFRFAWRGFRKTPGVFALAITAIALGIGGTTALFSILDRLMLRPLPYAGSDRMVVVGMKAPISASEFLLEGDYYHLRQNRTVFEDVTSFSRVGDCDLNEQEPLRLTCASVAANLLPFLGVNPIAGRQFLPQEDERGGPRAAMLSFAFWQRRFGGDRGVLGRLLQIDGRPVAVVGILPPNFELPNLASADLLLTQQLNIRPGVTYSFLTPIARLKTGVTATQARHALEPLFQEALKSVPAGFAKEVAFHVVSLKDRQVREYRTGIFVLFGCVVLLLLIACANVANLLTARSAARQSEFAVRAAIGASRARLIRQALTESVFLSLAGGAAGLLLGTLLLRVLLSFAPAGMVRLHEITLDGRILAFTTLVSALTGLLVGVAPALQIQGVQALRSARIAGRGWRISQGMVAVQVALSVVLLTSAGLFLQSLYRMQNAPLGLNPEQVTTVRVQLGLAKYPQDAQVNGFLEQALERLSNVPGVHAVALSDSVPLYGPSNSMIFSMIEVEGRPVDPKRATGGMTVARTVTPSYFPALGIPIVRGRGFNEEDRHGSDELLIVDETLARRLFPGQDAVGKRVRPSMHGPWRTIVGVARPVKNAMMAQEPEYYHLWRSRPELARRRAHYILRSSTVPAELTSFIRAEFRRLDPTLPVTVSTMTANLGTHFENPRLQTAMLVVFAFIGLLLAAVGQFGLVSYLVTQRSAEIGIRMAVGATPGHVLGLITGRVLLWVGAGSVAGLLGSFWLGRFLDPLLFGVKPHDGANFAVVLLILFVVSTAAALQPALRALRIDPADALRHD